MRTLAISLLVIVAGCADDPAPGNVRSQPIPDHAITNTKQIGGPFSEKELVVYAAAFRYAIYEYAGGGKGIIFLGIGEKDAPSELLGRIFRPASRAHLVDSDDRYDPTPRKRIRDKITGEHGSIIKVKIIEWLGDDRVKIECESYTAQDWAGGCSFFLRLKDGEWIDDGDDPDSYWAS